MDWDFFRLDPDKMMEPKEILSLNFPCGSMAGSVGKKQNRKKKPGIQEDGALAALSKFLRIYLLIDAHYSRDVTEIMIDQLQHDISAGLWNDFGKSPASDILMDHIITYCNKIVRKLEKSGSRGEASFCMLVHFPVTDSLYYFSVGDLMLFVNNPKRWWGPAYLAVNRHYYEWINSAGLGGFHFGTIAIAGGTRIILTTDGLIDKPSYKMDEIKTFFAFEHFEAEEYVKYALESVPEIQDDNIAIICLRF